MCTVSWIRSSPGAYTVFFNRDEQRSRALAQAPQEKIQGKLRYLAPTDGDAGGTWIASNERGLTLALLNFYDAQPAFRPTSPRSRGYIIPALMDLEDVESVTRALSARSHIDVLPFILVAFDSCIARAHRWDGKELRWHDLGDADGPITTSAFAPDAVAARRLACYRRMCATVPIDATLLDRYHRSTDPEGGAYSVWMNRSDAHTVSFSRVAVAPAQLEFLYELRADGCVVGASVTTTLVRA